MSKRGPRLRITDRGRRALAVTLFASFVLAVGFLAWLESIIPPYAQ